MRRQALDAGHVIMVGLGELGAEVAIALAPDDQGGRRRRCLNRAKRTTRRPRRVVGRRGGSMARTEDEASDLVLKLKEQEPATAGTAPSRV
jgi:hypothetical protein